MTDYSTSIDVLKEMAFRHSIYLKSWSMRKNDRLSKWNKEMILIWENGITSSSTLNVFIGLILNVMNMYIFFKINDNFFHSSSEFRFEYAYLIKFCIWKKKFGKGNSIWNIASTFAMQIIPFFSWICDRSIVYSMRLCNLAPICVCCTQNQMKSIYVNKCNQNLWRNDFGLADGICSIIVQMRSFIIH